MYAIELDSITKQFNSFIAVDNLSLKVPKGSIYGFIGPNGSGKTTTIRMIMNIFYPDNGMIKIQGETFSNRKILDKIGYLPEERGLYKKMKVRELLKFHGQLHFSKNLDEKITYWLKKLELQSWGNKKVQALSKGMSQKIQFIATIISEPEIIILDEPFSGLDPVNVDLLKSVILELRDKGSTIIFSTHDMYVAERMCDYIFMIYKGKKVLDGTLLNIQDGYGDDTIRVQVTDSNAINMNLPGVEKINDFGQIQEIKLKDGADSQEILKKILEKTRVLKFEITKPSLNDIFIRIAKPSQKDLNDITEN